MNILIALSGKHSVDAILSSMRGQKLPPHSRVLILHVVSRPMKSLSQATSQQQQSVQFQMKLLEDFACELKRLQPELEVEHTVVFGAVANSIISKAKTEQTDLIVMGSSQTRHGAPGSVISSVIGQTTCSVVVLKTERTRYLDLLLEDADMPQSIVNMSITTVPKR